MAEGAGNVQRHKGWRRAAQTGWVAHRGPVGRAHEGGWHIQMWVGMAGGTTGGRTVWVGGMETAEGAGRLEAYSICVGDTCRGMMCPWVDGLALLSYAVFCQALSSQP